MDELRDIEEKRSFKDSDKEKKSLEEEFVNDYMSMHGSCE